MSMPNIPNLNPTISINRDDTINLILSSIGMEELSLAHIVNAEAEKIQFALGTLETADGAASLEDIMNVNNSAKRMLRDVIKNQMLIGMKMEDTVDLATQAYAAAETKEEVAEEEVVTEEETVTKEEVAAEEKAQEEPVAEEEPAPEQA
ncbi:hypothetical protein RFF05_01945 [Bengtsoniella intestinalis]|uniref:hypothetical protein n=1 Tax=Bengtsoniella intestinalis TaxID=3073143 RepID=UPI00391F086D